MLLARTLKLSDKEYAYASLFIHVLAVGLETHHCNDDFILFFILFPHCGPGARDLTVVWG